MDNSEIRNRVREIKTVADLASLLNLIKQHEFKCLRYPITEKQLYYFCNSKYNSKRYKTFYISKKSGGTREINAPYPQLGVILHTLNVLLRSIYTPDPVVTGFTSGRSVIDNAKMHVGHHYVFNIDLKDFFPSITQSRVWARLQIQPFCFSKEIANVIAGLCCNSNGGVNVLPQGAPTSPLLTNAICDKLDRRMKGVAKHFGIHYSRYADDMTFSSMRNVYQEGREFRLEIKRIIEDQGFVMNDKKTRLLRAGQRQEVTGLTVNSIVNVTRKYIKDLRWILHVWEKEGYAKAYALFYPKYKKDKGYIKKGEPIMENVIGGRLNYLRMVKGASNPAYQKLASRYAALQNLVFVDNETDKSTSYIYVQPYTMAQFNEWFQTDVTLEITQKHNLVGKCTIAGMEKTLAISNSTKKIFIGEMPNFAQGEITIPNSLKQCYVTLCRHKGKNFWLITRFEPKRSKCLSVQNAKLDIDELLNIWDKCGLEEAVDSFQMFLKHGVFEPISYDSTSTSTANLSRDNNCHSVNHEIVLDSSLPVESDIDINFDDIVFGESIRTFRF